MPIKLKLIPTELEWTRGLEKRWVNVKSWAEPLQELDAFNSAVLLGGVGMRRPGTVVGTFRIWWTLESHSYVIGAMDHLLLIRVFFHVLNHGSTDKTDDVKPRKLYDDGRLPGPNGQKAHEPATRPSSQKRQTCFYSF